MRNFVRVGWLLVIGILVTFGFWFTDTHGIQSGQSDVDEVLERPWIDHMPHSRKEPFRLYFFTRAKYDNGELLGVYRLADSAFKFHQELFTQQVTDKEIRWTFLHDNVVAASAYRLEHVKPDRDDLDMKLSLSRDPRSNGRSAVFYSNSAWREREVPAALQSVGARPW